MIKLPKIIKVAGFDITIEEWTPQEAATQQCFGEFIALTQTISIDSSVHPYKVLDTLFHELLHAIMWAYALNDKDKEEQIARVLSTALTQVFRDNPYLTNFIQDTIILNSDRTWTVE